MKKLAALFFLLIMVCSNLVYAKNFEPSKKVVLFYRVSDVILQVQNKNEDMVAGQEELEKELKDHYSNRFIVQEIRRAPNTTITAKDLKRTIRPNQAPLYVEIKLGGESQTTHYYQNAFGAQASGVAPTTIVSLLEALPNANYTEWSAYNYGEHEYTAGTFASGLKVYAIETDPRKNVKNAVRAIFRDACKFNGAINKYTNPLDYQIEYARYSGDFDSLRSLTQQKNAPLLAKVDRFNKWVAANPDMAQLIPIFESLPTLEAKALYVDEMTKLGYIK